MKSYRIAVNLFFLIVLSCFPVFANKTDAEKELGLTKKLQYETARVLVFNENKTVLDEIDSLDWFIKVSDSSEQYISGFKQNVNHYKSIAIKRDRLQYIFNQRKSMALASAVPNVLSVATVAMSSGDWKRAVIAVAGTTLNSVTNYIQTKKNVELELLQAQWELDDEARNAFSNLQQGLYSHLSRMAREYGFENEDFVSNETLKDFVKRIDEKRDDPIEIFTICTKYEKELAKYPEFWGAKAKSLYEQGLYSDALECISKYEECYERVFYHDNEYTQLMLIKAYCIDETISDISERVLRLEEIVSEIVANLGPEADWVQQYYCYLTFKDLSDYTNNKQYLEKAWNLLYFILDYNIDQYANDLKAYMNYDYLEKGRTEIQSLIEENNKTIATKEEQKKAVKTKVKKNDFKKEINKLKEKNSELKANITQLEKSIKTELPPTESFILSLAREFMSLSHNLEKKNTPEYKLMMEKLSTQLKDDFYQECFIGVNSLPSKNPIKATFIDKNKVLWVFGEDVKEMRFQIPLGSFTFVSDNFTDMTMKLFNERVHIEKEIQYNSDSSEAGWSYEIIRPADEVSSDYNMQNVMIAFTVRFDDSFEKIPWEKGAELPSLFVELVGDNNPLHQSYMLDFNSDRDSMENLQTVVFDVK